MKKRNMVNGIVSAGLGTVLLLVGILGGARATRAEPVNAGEAPEAGTSYLHISGSVFGPPNSVADYAYGGNGCVYFTSGDSTFLQFPLQLPSGSTITQLRLYYKDTNTTHNGTMSIREFDDGLTYADIVSLASAGDGGWGTATVNFTKVPDYVNYSYVLIWYAPAADVSIQLCGFRVAYTPPSIFGVALPVIRK